MGLGVNGPQGRDPTEVPITLVRCDAEVAGFAVALAEAEGLAIDTETVYSAGDGHEAGALRVVSAATRSPGGRERAWVVDRRDVDLTRLAPVLDGLSADAWNATFDARVLDEAVFRPAGYGRGSGLRWWDAQLADAVLHAGVSGFTWFHGLAWASEHYLGVEASGKGTVQLSFDAVSDLSAEQVAYAAADAIETLWVADVLRGRLSEVGLDATAALEMAARPFLDHLERCGLPFDPAGYAAYLAERAAAMALCASRLAELTGGGQGNLFSTDLEPSWNPASEPQAKAALNRWAPDRVAAWFEGRGVARRPLADTDALDATTLAEIGGPLAEALLAYRSHAKLLSAYGDNLTPFLGADGRFHPQYVQVVGVNTGRLSSRNPNAQTFPPEMKPFVRPASADRVFVHADVSQAELRWLAQVSGDEALRDAFRAGRDVHVSTAERMFRLDMAALAGCDPARHKSLRARAKAINFGIVYGQGAQALARGLTLAGSPTSPAEAQELLDAYLLAYPGVAAWLERQDRQVEAAAARTSVVDWGATLRLYDDLVPVAGFRREFRDRHRRWPSRAEVLGAHPGVAPWALRYEEPIVLLGPDRPLSWSSRTLGGRRRRFTVATSGVLRRAASLAAGGDDARLVGTSRVVAARQGVSLPPPGPALDKVFDDRPLRRAVLEAVWQEQGEAVALDVLRRAASQSVRVMANAHRNAPIQGGVADAMLAAYAELWERLAGDVELAPVLTVHDSLVVECPEGRADEVGAMVVASLEAGFARFCPDVPLAVDVDTRSSLAPPSSPSPPSPPSSASPTSSAALPPRAF
jgi:DNA polymerase I-like protein with 3'-5' exonuclease and polymerase domains